MKEILRNSQEALLTSGYNRVKPAVSNKKTVSANKLSDAEKWVIEP